MLHVEYATVSTTCIVSRLSDARGELFCFYWMVNVVRVPACSAQTGAEGVLSLWGTMRAGSQGWQTPHKGSQTQAASERSQGQYHTVRCIMSAEHKDAVCECAVSASQLPHTQCKEIHWEKVKLKINKISYSCIKKSNVTCYKCIQLHFIWCWTSHQLCQTNAEAHLLILHLSL